MNAELQPSGGQGGEDTDATVSLEGTALHWARQLHRGVLEVHGKSARACSTKLAPGH